MKIGSVILTLEDGIKILACEEDANEIVNEIIIDDTPYIERKTYSGEAYEFEEIKTPKQAIEMQNMIVTRILVDNPGEIKLLYKEY